MTDPALDVEGLAVDYRVRRRHVRAVENVTFSLEQGETLAIVGESGSGKSTIGKALLGLVPVAAGSVRLAGRDISHLRPAQRRLLAADIQMIFQNPYGSLNPSLRIGQILEEPLTNAGRMSRADARARIGGLLAQVNLPADALDRYPSAFSGGQRQRIAIARALALRPGVVVCDEPTSALDVSTQASVLSLLRDLQSEMRMSYVFITHDLAVVREFADRVVVLQKGQIVETGSSRQICDSPHEAYTQRLVAAAPVPDPVVQRRRRQARLDAAAGSTKIVAA